MRDVSTDQQDQGLAANLVIDRDTASRLGITASAIDQVLYDAFGQRQVSTMYTGLNQYFVVMEVDPQYQLSPDSLNDIYIKASTITGAAASVATLGSTTLAAATAASAATTSVPASAASSATPAVFATSGGQLVTSSTSTTTSATTSSTTSSTTSATTSAPTSASTTSNTADVATNIAAIAAATGESTTAASISSGTLTGMIAAASSTSAVSSTGGLAAAPAPAAPTPQATAQWSRSRLSPTGNSSAHRSPSITRVNIQRLRSLSISHRTSRSATLSQPSKKHRPTWECPAAVHATFQGTAQAFQDSLKNEPYLILAALVAVYIVLGILYESLIHPLTILSTLPPAGVGAILALLVTGTDLSIMALIGILLLIGIVKKNAIMMIDFALQAERDHGLPPVEAIYQACLLRFRPIMMTTMAAMFGGLPLAIGMGVGSELRKPLGITIVGGLLVSQMLTLFTTPVVYLFFDRLQWRVMKLHRIGAELEEAPGD